MKKENVIVAVKQLIDSKSNVQLFSEPDDSLKFIDDLLMDSIDSIELIMEIEKLFRIDISDDQAEYMLTVGDLVNYVLEHVDYE